MERTIKTTTNKMLLKAGLESFNWTFLQSLTFMI